MKLSIGYKVADYYFMRPKVSQNPTIPNCGRIYVRAETEYKQKFTSIDKIIAKSPKLPNLIESKILSPDFRSIISC